MFRDIKERQAKEELIEYWVKGEQSKTNVERNNTPRIDGATNVILQAYIIVFGIVKSILIDDDPELHASAKEHDKYFFFSSPFLPIHLESAFQPCLSKDILNTDLFDLNTTIGFDIFAFVVGYNGATLGVVVVSVALETLHLSRLHVVEVLLAEMDAADLVADDVGFDVLLALCLFDFCQQHAPKHQRSVMVEV